MTEKNYTRINSTLDYTEYLDEEDRRHRLNGPAFEYLETHPNFPTISFWINGMLHRVGGPAHTFYRYKNKSDENWHKNNLRHRLNAPASIYYDNGKINSKYYFEFGQLIHT